MEAAIQTWWCCKLRLDGSDGGIIDAGKVDLELGTPLQVALEDLLRARGAFLLRKHVEVFFRLFPEEKHAQASALRQERCKAVDID